MIDYQEAVTLGPIDRAHLEKIREWRNDYRVWAWCRQNDLISEWDQANWYERQAADQSVKMYMVNAEQVPVGVCGLTSIDLYNRRAEFSLYIAPQFRENGYGKAALNTLVKHGFNTLNLHNIWGESFDGNPAIRMFKEVGFQIEGVRRDFYYREGRYVDAHLFSVLSTDIEVQACKRAS